MFWRFVPTMFFASCIGTAIVTVGGTMYDNARLHGTLERDRFTRRLDEEFARSAALLDQHDMSPALCETVLETLAERVMRDLPDRTAPNGFPRSVLDKRLLLSFHSATGPNCSFPSGPVQTPLRVAVDDAIHRLQQSAGAAGAAGPAAGAGPDSGWISAVAIAPKHRPDAIVAAGFFALSPWRSIAQAEFPWVVLSIYILIINSLSALTLVLLIVRRIRRAEHAAAAWTQGQLSIRISDPQHDEFARLARSFDVMADTMSGVIEVKQALAAAEERNRLARDLHDTAKQRAFAVGLQLSAAKNIAEPDSQTAALITGALSSTNHLQRDLAEVIRRLSAPTIVESGLRNVLTEGINGLLSGSTIRWKLVLGAGDEKVLDGLHDVAAQLFMITMEAAANTLKHTRSTEFTVTCHAQGSHFTWRWVDDGQGFEVGEAASAGMGVSNMKLRASSLPRGSISIVSHPGMGTAIEVTFDAMEIDR